MIRAASAILTVCLVVVLFITPVRSQDPTPVNGVTIANGRPAVAGEVLVKYWDNVVSEDAGWQADADVQQPVGGTGLQRLHSQSLDADDLVATLEWHPDVEYVEPNYLIAAIALPNDPSFANLWGLFNSGQNVNGSTGISGDDIDAPTAWLVSTGSRNSVMGVIDTGIDYTHPDLAANVWSAPSQFTVNIGGQAITCAAGTHGFNAITRTCDPMDDNNHGSHVSGTIGGVGNNGVGVAGINWTASIMGLKFLGSNGSGSTSDALNAMEFAIQAKAAFAGSNGANVRVLSNSWGGGGFSQAMVDEIVKANTNDMLFVAAAGNATNNNDTNPFYPANYVAPNMVTVAATDNRDALASFSNYGATTVHIAAPGVNILSTTRSNTYSYFNGTSMATPHVSGAALLVLSACSLTTANLRAALLNNVDLVGALATKVSTGGRLNVGRAIQSCARVTSATITPSVAAPQNAGTTVTFTATGAGGVAPYQYQWWVHDGTKWTMAQNWGASNTFAWTPNTTNAAYQVGVWVKSPSNTGDPYAGNAQLATAAYPILTRATAVALTPSVAAPQNRNTTITFTAAASGGTPPYQYRYAVYDGVSWTFATNWSATATFAWTPTLLNSSYYVAAWARSNGNSTNTPEVTKSIAYPIVIPTVTSLTLSPNKTAPQLAGTSITWTATATGGIAPYEYQFWLYNGSVWSALTNWTTTNTYTWTPATANGGYYVSVWARSSGNTTTTEATKSAAFAIAAPVSSVALVANKVSPQIAGTAITWTATPTGGVGPYQYKFSIYNGTAWTAVTGWTTTNTYTWTPASANANYYVSVWARSAGNAIDAPEANKSVKFPIQ
ncbi:MAG TPA: S8 family peptidase [Vicinamibacterales bacterium]|nr:S8 family peptidase [Vicinamibacterales bacterium]